MIAIVVNEGERRESSVFFFFLLAEESIAIKAE